MKWNQDDTIQYFVNVDDEQIELNAQFYKGRPDTTSYTTSAQVRELLAQEIKELLDR